MKEADASEKSAFAWNAVNISEVNNGNKTFSFMIDALPATFIKSDTKKIKTPFSVQ
ncbi:hypothetical protein AB9Q52_008430 [Pantoea vagans]